MSGFYEVTAASGYGGGGRRVCSRARLGQHSRESSRRQPHPHGGIGCRRPVGSPLAPRGSLRSRPAYRTQKPDRPAEPTQHSRRSGGVSLAYCGGSAPLLRRTSTRASASTRSTALSLVEWSRSGKAAAGERKLTSTKHLFPSLCFPPSVSLYGFLP